MYRQAVGEAVLAGHRKPLGRVQLAGIAAPALQPLADTDIRIHGADASLAQLSRSCTARVAQNIVSSLGMAVTW